MRDTFIRTLTQLAKNDPRIFLVTADVGFGVLTNFAENFPKQFLNVGVAEQNMTGIATGLALEGRVVFTYSIANFPTIRCLEQIRNDAAYHHANVKIVAIGGGFSYGALGMSHHATEDLAIMRSMPITVVAPGSAWETEQATQSLIKTPGTCYLRLDRGNDDNTDQSNEEFTLGKARRLREGKDITIISTGGILHEALDAAKILENKNISARIISMHTVNPIDKNEIIDAAKNSGGIVTIEEHTTQGGLGGAVSEVCMDSGILPKTFYRMGLKGEFSSLIGNQQYLRNYYKINAAAIVEVAESLIKK